MFNDLLKHRSGRVVALARAVLVATFLFAIAVDPTRPSHAVATTYSMLVAYLAGAIAVALLTWNDWWLDAKLAMPTHVVDIVAFTLLVLVTDGYTSPFFVFFVFLILSAAIRWGWRETALTAIAVTLLYFGAGFIGGDSSGRAFDLQRFIIRASNLVILSAILIWFGVNQGFAGFRPSREDLIRDVPPDEPPLESAVETAVRLTGGKAAVLLWRRAGSHDTAAVSYRDGEVTSEGLADPPAMPVPLRSFLFDVPRNRALSRGPHRRMRFLDARRLMSPEIGRRFAIDSGLAVPIRTDAGEGTLVLGGIRSLCTDHIEFGETLSEAVASHIQRHALLAAVEDGAVSRARLSLARDLHDSVVQFLAGATFRIEAIRRSIRAGDQPDRELADLKELMLHEQQELRSAIGALRRERIPLPSLAADLRTLCGRLARQWDIECSFSAEVPDIAAPMRLHLDTHQLIREAVANAVRHAHASTVGVQLTADDGDLRLDISNDGSGSERLKEGSPWSLRERVDDANGTLMLATRDTGTSVSITLPLKTEPRP